MVFVTFSSLFSFSEVSTPSFNIPHLDKAVHFTFYFMAVVLGVFAIREKTQGSTSLIKALFVMICVAIVFGMVIEVIQSVYTADRQGDVLDGLANSIGAIFGGAITKIYFSKKWALKWK
ncbi:VanZ family protein [uncultured Maribacter sp.]|uniref:VanZ family protein n=1 Tax=uncultured Maribacter sp. TaxID=431308 RepID=UPI0026035F23|nr:VanZ family protein [uncultured Maribacter sp.]